MKACLGLVPLAAGTVAFWGKPLAEARGPHRLRAAARDR
jgi:hypothetical protein